MLVSARRPGMIHIHGKKSTLTFRGETKGCTREIFIYKTRAKTNRVCVFTTRGNQQQTRTIILSSLSSSSLRFLSFACVRSRSLSPRASARQNEARDEKESERNVQ